MAQGLEGYKILSADDHTFERSDLWVTRLPKNLQDRAPRLRSLDDLDMWYYGDFALVPLSPGTHPGRRYEEDPAVRTEIGKTRTREEHLRPGAYDPDERVKDLDIDGIDKAIHYSTVGLHLYRIEDREFLHELHKVYNDWLSEYCAAHPDRLYGIALINPELPDKAIEELERCKKMGMVGALVPVWPSPGMRYNHEMYEPFWAACQDLQIPVSFHIGCNRPGPENEFMDFSKLTPSWLSNVDFWPRNSLGDMIFAGVFERYPGLKVGVIEHEVSWIPHFLERIDYTYTDRLTMCPVRFKNDAMPSDFWKANCFVGFQQDPHTMRLRDIIGVDNIQFGADYPHDEGTFPMSRQVAEEVLAGCTDEEKQKIVWDNAARTYGIS